MHKSELVGLKKERLFFSQLKKLFQKRTFVFGSRQKNDSQTNAYFWLPINNWMINERWVLEADKKMMFK